MGRRQRLLNTRASSGYNAECSDCSTTTFLCVKLKPVNCYRSFELLTVAMLYGVIIVGGSNFPVSLEFKTITACNVARIALEAKHAGATLSCLDGVIPGVGVVRLISRKR